MRKRRGEPRPFPHFAIIAILDGCDVEAIAFI
jgi:hypothetical protein